jgi:phage shock protein PspC (stress-responsive transcriptional regulator)
MHMEMKHRLYRSRDERMLAGVAGGIANYFDVDPTIVAAIAYLGCALVIPREPETTLV